MTRPAPLAIGGDLLAAFAPPPAIIQQQACVLVRCWCRECRALDARHPGEGYQLTFRGSGGERLI